LEFQKQVNQFIFKYFTIGNIHIPVVWNAEVRQEGRKLPVVVFSHGLGASHFFYSTICMELASYGFVVAAVEHR
jgi:platelet-activating factor acetylhydrolase